MANEVVVQAFVDRVVAGDDHLAADGDTLTVDGWWPAALWLGTSTCLVRLDEDEQPGLAAELAGALGATGLVLVDVDLDAPIEAVTIQRLGLAGSRWQVWSADSATAQAAITQAA